MNGYRLEMGSSQLRLIEFHGSARKQLAQIPIRYETKNTLLVIRRKDLLRVAFNGKIVLETSQASIPIKQVSLVDTDGRIQLLEEPRYQPTDDIYLTDDFMTAPGDPSRWQSVAGTWHIAGVSRPRHASDPFKFVGFANSAGVAINTDSRWFWNDYQVSASAALSSPKSGMGIVFGYQGPERYYIFSWGGSESNSDNSNQARLWRCDGSRKVLLASAPACARKRQWYRLSVATHGTTIRAFVDEHPVIEAKDDRLVGGKCGLYVSGTEGAEFDDVAVVSTEGQGKRRIAGNSEGSWQNRQFGDDPYMTSWGNAQADWEPVNGNGQTWYWYRGSFFNSVVLTIPIPSASSDSGRLPAEAVIFGSSDDPKQGYHLVIEPGKVSILKSGKVLGVAQSTAATADVSVAPGGLSITSGEKQLLIIHDGAPVSGGQVGVRFKGWGSVADLTHKVRVTSPSILEYRFDTAPVDWEVESGDWIATNRWACVPVWNFFGGRGNPTATLWNKRGFAGDQWIEAFIAPREGSSDRMHFTYPINLNLTFCAKNRRLGTGYTLVYQAHDGATLLYREDKVVATNKDLVLPNWRADQNFVYYRVTQTWQHLQILRQGGRIRIWAEIPSNGEGKLNRRMLFDYTDPSPLAGDQLALWTWGDNGMAVARMRVGASKLLPPIPSFLSSPPSNGNHDGVLHCVNPINGGQFRIDLIDKPVDPRSMPVVSFDYQADNATALALYAVAGGQRFRAKFLGDIANDGDSMPMGEVKSQQPNPKSQTANPTRGMSHAEFPLLQSLRACFPSGEIPKIENLFLADLSNRPDHVGGLSVNARGAVFDWRPASGKTPPGEGRPVAVAGAPPVASASPAADRIDTFEENIGEWKTIGGEQGASLWRDTTIGADSRCSLRLYHRRLAGSFGAMISDKPFDARRWPSISFSYRTETPIYLNLICELAGKWYEIRFTDDDNTFPVIGSVRSVKRRHGALEWTDAEVNLLEAVRRSGAGTTIVSRLFFADSGIMNNLQDACWHLDNFRFVAASALTSDGPTPVVSVSPRTGDRIAAPAAEIQLSPENSVDIETIRWVAQVGAVNKEYRLDDSADTNGGLRFDASRNLLMWSDSTLTAGSSPQPYALNCELTASDLSGKPLINEHWTWTVDPALDKTPPPAPYVSYVPANRLCRYDFENAMPSEVELRRAAWVLHEKDGGATGTACARVINLEANDFFSTFLRKVAYPVHQYPRVTFDYRFGQPGCNLNVVSVVNGDMQIVEFAGQNGAYDVFVQNTVGRIPDVVQDGQWRHAEFDFGGMLKKRYPDTPRFFADYLGTWATGINTSYDNPPGASLWLDNITLYSTDATSASFEWKPPFDPNGIRAYSFVLDQKPDTVPDEATNSQETHCEFKDLKPGKWFFHLRASDGAGNWGATSHIAFELTASVH